VEPTGSQYKVHCELPHPTDNPNPDLERGAASDGKPQPPLHCTTVFVEFFTVSPPSVTKKEKEKIKGR